MQKLSMKAVTPARVRRLAFSCAVLAAAVAGASTSTWNNATGNWSVGTNWLEGVTPVASDATTLVFGGSGTTGYSAINDMPSGFFVNGITLNSSSTALATLAPGVSGNILRFGGNGPFITQDGAGDFYFRNLVDVSKPLTWGGAGVGNVTFDGGLTGAAGIIKNGASAFRLGSPAIGTASTDTFFGGFTVNDGTIRYNNSSDSGRTAARSNRFTLTSATATLVCISQLRIGEVNGTGTVIAQDGSGNGDGHDITFLGLGDGAFAGTVNTLPAVAVAPAIQSTISGKLNTRGLGIQTLSGSVKIDNDVSISRSTGITLAGTATLAGTTRGIIQLHGGTFTLDNTSVNNNNRLRDSGTSATGIEDVGGGTFALIGNAAGTTETIGRFDFGSATAARGGAIRVRVIQPVSASAATVLNMAGYQRDSTKIPRGTLDFSAMTTAGTSTTLGLVGMSPRILFTSAFTVPLRNGLLSRTNLTANDNVGWATVNGSDFATYGVNGIAAVPTVVFPAAGDPTLNTTLTGSAAVSTGSTFSVNSLKIAPTAAGQSLTLNGTTALSTNALLLAGDIDFTIAGTGSIGGPGGARYVTVQSAALRIDPSLGTAAPLSKAGAGMLILNAGTNVSSQQPLTINDGTVRAASGSSLPSGVVEFRGGVLELTTSTFARSLGSTINQINWRTDSTSGGFFPGISDTDKGSGGFSAFGTPVAVTLNAAGSSTLVWEDSYFVDGAHSLIFGSTRSDARLTLQNGIALTGGGSVSYNMREIHVIDNPLTSADCTNISGPITGALSDDLVKTGDGTLELSGSNMLPGGVIVGEGKLLIATGNSLSAGAYALISLRSGNADAGLFASHMTGLVQIARDIGVQVGSSGIAEIGNRIASGNTTAGDVDFTGHLTLGITGSNADKTVRLTAEPATTVRFTGLVEKTPGYLGTTTVRKTGPGLVRFSSGVNVADNLFVDAGILRVDANATVAGTSRLTTLAIAPVATLDITSNALIVDYTGASPLTDITALITSAYASGSWTGSGLTSSLAGGAKAVGAIETPSDQTSFGGRTVDATSVLVRLSLKGDTNLDGAVDFPDLLALAQRYGSSGSWVNGDTDYDGQVAFSDLLALAQNYGTAAFLAPGVGASEFASDWALAQSLGVVPEPITGVGVICLLMVRRQRKVSGEVNRTS